jgi:hypothetical protein
MRENATFHPITSLISVLVLILAAAACAGVEEPTPTPTETAVPASATPVKKISLVFTGEECTYTGPAVFESGSIPMVFSNQSDMSASVKSAILGEGGDFADLDTFNETVGEPGSEVDLTLFKGPFSRTALAGTDWEGERAFNPGTYILTCSVSNRIWDSTGVIEVR